MIPSDGNGAATNDEVSTAKKSEGHHPQESCRLVLAVPTCQSCARMVFPQVNMRLRKCDMFVYPTCVAALRDGGVAWKAQEVRKSVYGG